MNGQLGPLWKGSETSSNMWVGVIGLLKGKWRVGSYNIIGGNLPQRILMGSLRNGQWDGPNPVPLCLSATGVLGGHGESWAAAKHCAPQAPRADSAQLLESPVDGSPRFISWCGWPSPTSLAGAPCQEPWRPRHHFSLEGRRRQWEACPERPSSWGDLTCRVGGDSVLLKGKVAACITLGKMQMELLKSSKHWFFKVQNHHTENPRKADASIYCPLTKQMHLCTHARTCARTHTGTHRIRSLGEGWGILVQAPQLKGRHGLSQPWPFC